MLRRTFLTGLGSAIGAATLLPTAAHAGEDIHVSSYGALMYGVPYTVAIAKGFFKQAGVDITGVLGAKGGGTTVRNVLAGGLPYGEVSLAAAVAGANSGLDIRIVNTGVRSAADFAWVTMPGSPIASAKDLLGKKVAITQPKSISEMLVILCLKASGVDPASVTRVALGGVGPGLTALEKGAVDAAPIIDPILSARKERYRAIFSTKELLPPMTQSVSIAASEFISKQPDTLKAIIAGRRKGVDFIYANRDETAAIIAKEYDNLPAEVARRAIGNLIPIRYWSEGGFELDGMNEMVKGLQLIGEINGDVDWHKLVDARFLPADVKPGL